MNYVGIALAFGAGMLGTGVYLFPIAENVTVSSILPLMVFGGVAAALWRASMTTGGAS